MTFPSAYRDNAVYDFDFDDDDYGPDFCRHGYSIYSSSCKACADIEDEIERNGGIDKCMNCGRYKYGRELSRYQVCVRPCRNPNEY